MLIVASSWVVFWMSGESLASRMGISLTGILTIVAYQFLFAGVLPRITYFTFWDTVITLSFVLMVITAGINVLTANLRDHKRESLARRIDRMARICFPAVYVLGLALFSAAYFADGNDWCL